MNTPSQPKSFKDLDIDTPPSLGMEGPKIEPDKLFGREIMVHKYSIGPSKIPGKENTQCLTMQISINGSMRVVFCGSKYLIDTIKKIPSEAFPFTTTIVRKDNNSYQFT